MDLSRTVSKTNSDFGRKLQIVREFNATAQGISLKFGNCGSPKKLETYPYQMVERV